MVRPCFLIIDREHSGSISTRKLVIETAKFNVITAYSSAEAIATVRKYPAVDGVVLDAGMKDMPCAELIEQLKTLRPGLPVIAVGTPRVTRCDEADHYLASFEPKLLLGLLQELHAAEATAIERRNEELQAEGD